MDRLQRAGIPVRWCDTHGEQCHAKMLLADYANGESVLLLGSANFTRRNLQDFNLETNVAVRGSPDAQALRDARAYFELVWGNDGGRVFSVPYEAYGEESTRKRFLYWLQETTGLSSF